MKGRIIRIFGRALLELERAAHKIYFSGCHVGLRTSFLDRGCRASAVPLSLETSIFQRYARLPDRLRVLVPVNRTRAAADLGGHRDRHAVRQCGLAVSRRVDSE